jgi:uncharacterized damage-inducible protein DinB
MPRGRPLDVPAELIDAFVQCGRVTEYLIGVIPAAIWRAAPPGGRGRTIAANVAHIQSVRRTFARMGGAQPSPPSLDRKTCTPAEAQRAIRLSTDALAALFARAMADGRARVKGQPRRVVDMALYLMQHDAHHRGQIFVLAKDLDHEFAAADVTRVWGWSRLP